MSDDKIAEIRKRHAFADEHKSVIRPSGFSWTVPGWQAHNDRATLLAEVERLTRERDEARSKETDYREGFEEGWDAAQRGAAAVVERMREALIEWDALIQHQYSGSREAMTDMQYAALKTKRILDELDAPKALEAKP